MGVGDLGRAGSQRGGGGAEGLPGDTRGEQRVGLGGGEFPL